MARLTWGGRWAILRAEMSGEMRIGEVGSTVVLAIALAAAAAFVPCLAIAAPASPDGGAPDAAAGIDAGDDNAGKSDRALILELQKELHDYKSRMPPPAAAPLPPPAPEKPKRLDESKPPFGEFNFSWMNGSNGQPPSLLTMGPLTWAIYIDAYYAFQFAQPIDHTIFPTTTAPRHNEISFNLGILGVEITGLDGPIGRIYVQYGSNIVTDAGQDTTVNRGYFLTTAAFQYLEQAALGWHFHVLHGLNLEVGIFNSYIGLESYLPQENWSYTHAFLSDVTPYYFFGFRGQLFITQRLKLEVWLVNGWQTFGTWHEAKGGGYYLNWRPREWLSLVNAFYIGQEVEGDPQSLRPYSDNNIQIRYYKGEGALKSGALSLTADIGYEHRGTMPPNAVTGLPPQSGLMAGASLANRFVWTDWLSTTLRFDVYYDETGALVQQLPVGNPYHLPAAYAPHFGVGGAQYLLGGLSATIDLLPSPWVLFRLEYSHRESNRPYFTGSGGITGPSGVQGPLVPSFTPDLAYSDNRLIINATLRL